MTDYTPPPPIVVNGTPNAEQLAAGLRYVIMLLGGAASAVGAGHLAGQLNALLVIVGPIAAIIAFIWGQVVTRKSSQAKTIMAAALPDSVAKIK